MYLAYIDESGDTGYSKESSKKSSDYYILGGIIIRDVEWDKFHSGVKVLISNTIKNYCVSKKVVEVHLKLFKNGKKGWQKSKLKNYYLDLLNFLRMFPNVYVFSVLIDKKKINAPLSNPLPNVPIKFLTERLSHLANVSGDRVLIIVDNSSLGLHASWRETISKLKNAGDAYNKSSHFSNGIIEEALFVDSKVSPEVQIADSIVGFTLLAARSDPRFPNFPNDFNFYSPKGKSNGWGLKIWP